MTTTQNNQVPFANLQVPNIELKDALNLIGAVQDQVNAGLTTKATACVLLDMVYRQAAWLIDDYKTKV